MKDSNGVSRMRNMEQRYRLAFLEKDLFSEKYLPKMWVDENAADDAGAEYVTPAPVSEAVKSETVEGDCGEDAVAAVDANSDFVNYKAYTFKRLQIKTFGEAVMAELVLSGGRNAMSDRREETKACHPFTTG